MSLSIYIYSIASYGQLQAEHQETIISQQLSNMLCYIYPKHHIVSLSVVISTPHGLNMP